MLTSQRSGLWVTLMCVQAGEVVCERFGPRVFRQTSGVVGDLLPNDYDTCTSQRSGL